MIYGFASVTTSYQDIDYQVERIQNKYSDASVIKSDLKDMDALSSLMTDLRDGDLFVITDILRLDNSGSKEIDTIFKTVAENYEKIFSSGADIIILDSPYLNSDIFRIAITSSRSKDSASLVAAVSEILETQIRILVENMLSRSEKRAVNIKNSIKNSKKRIGNEKGSRYHIKKEKPAKDFIKARLVDFGGDLSNEEAMKELHIARNTFFKYKKQVLADISSSKAPDSLNKASESAEVAVSKAVQKKPLEKRQKTSKKKDVVHEATPDAVQEESTQELKDIVTESTEEKSEKDAEKRKKGRKTSVDGKLSGQTSIFDFL